MVEKDIKIIELHVNDNDAKENIEQLRKKVEELNQQRKTAERELKDSRTTDAQRQRAKERIKEIVSELKKNTRELERSENRVQALTEGLRRMDKQTPKELQKTIRQINAELNSGAVKRGSEQWDAYTEALKSAKKELQDIRKQQEVEEDKSFGDKISDFGNKWVGTVASIAGGMEIFDNAKQWVSSFVNMYADMKEHMSGVSKYTGLAAEAVDELNEAFKKIDTRTPREKLNDLAADAGRLGIKGTQNILDFVDAADQINLALGEDLGEDGVKNIGKLTQLFSDGRAMGLKNGMLATASVINELAQSSSAAEPYLLEFTARLASIGNTANMAQSDITSIAAVLDQGMVGVEKGATAMQNVLTAIYRRPAKMAKAAGLDVKKFTELVKTDANAALLQFIGALKDARSLENIAPMLEEMKLSGSGVTQTLATLANGLDNLKATQQQAALAFLEHTSATKEAEAANSTVQAQLEKAQKAYKDLAVELGGHLEPVVKHMVSSTGLMAKALLYAIRFAVEHKRALITLGVAMAAYTTGLIITTAWEKRFWVAKALNLVADKAAAMWTAIKMTAIMAWNALLALVTLNTERAAIAQIIFNRAMAANPIGLLLAGIAALVTLLITFAQKTEDLTQKRSVLNDVQKEAVKKATEEIEVVKRLHQIIRNSNEAYDTRRKAIEQLQKMVPGYHASLTKEGKLTERNTKAIAEYIRSLQNKALAEAAYDKLVELQKARIEQQMTVDRKKYNIRAVDRELKKKQYESRTQRAVMYSPSTESTYPIDPIEYEGNELRTKKLGERQKQVDALNSAQTELNETTKQINQLNNFVQGNNEVKNFYGKLINQKATDFSTDDTGSGTYTPHGTTDEKKGSKVDKLKKKELEDGKKFIVEVDKQHREANDKLKVQFAQGLITTEEYNNAVAKNDEQALKRKRDFYTRNLDQRQKWQDELNKHADKEKKRTEDWSIAEIDKRHKAELDALEHKEAEGLITTEEYEKQRDRLTLEHLKARADYYKQWGRVDDYEKAAAALQEEDNKQRLAREKKYQEKLKQLRNEYLKKSAGELFQEEMKVISELHTRKLISEEEYLRLQAALRLKYQGDDGRGGLIAEERQKRAEELLTSARHSASSTLGTQRDDKDESSHSGTTNAFGVSELAKSALKLRIHAATYDALKRMREKDKEHALEYAAAFKQLDRERVQGITEAAAAAYSTFGAVVSTFSDLQRAEADAQVARTEREYDAKIKAAEGDREQTEKLEAEKQAAVAKIKNDYNQRAANIQVAQAVAGGAMAAINAYSSAAAIPIVGHVLAPIAAALAVATTAAQIATIRKQAEAQQSGYYEGGFTPGRRYRRTAGVVHEGEFVANHKAVNNPAVLPVLRLIDHAQRNNTIASLTAADVSRAIAAPGVPPQGRTPDAEGSATHPAMAQRRAQPDTVPAETVAQGLQEAIDRLNVNLESGIRSTVSIDGRDGVAYQLDKFRKLTDRK
nr:MAG TPA: tail tape measure protein [Caudoviricetes sp.]